MLRFVLSDLVELASLGAFLTAIVMVAHAMGTSIPV
jgi:hypothetical protein